MQQGDIGVRDISELAASVKRHDTADIDRVKTENRETNFDRWTTTYRPY
jgi:hypothetical protein